MGGWYGNRRNGCIGRGSGSDWGRGRYTTRTSHIKKTVDDYFFYVVSSKQASDYEIIAELVVNNIKNTSDQENYVSDTLGTLSKADTNVWNQTLNISYNTYANIKVIEENQFVKEYKAGLDEYMRLKQTYRENLYTLYALLWEQYANMTQNKIVSILDYNSLTYKNSIELLR